MMGSDSTFQSLPHNYQKHRRNKELSTTVNGILHLSDTHGKHHLIKDLPPADIIVHSGDLSEDGKNSEVMDFLAWFCDLEYRHKIFVAGNHDLCLYGAQIEGLPENCHHLYHSGVEIEGLKFWGVPYFLSNELNSDTAQLLAQIPPDTDILITHRPPYGILDIEGNCHFGCNDLLQFVLQLRPRYHLFGHVHAGYGIEKSQHTTFVNASLVRKNKIVNQPFLFEYAEIRLFKDNLLEEQLVKLGLNRRQVKAVLYVKEKGKITNKEYQELNLVTKPTATRDLSELVSLKIVEQSGNFGAGSYFQLITPK